MLFGMDLGTRAPGILLKSGFVSLELTLELLLLANGDDLVEKCLVEAILESPNLPKSALLRRLFRCEFHETSFDAGVVVASKCEAWRTRETSLWHGCRR